MISNKKDTPVFLEPIKKYTDEFRSQMVFGKSTVSLVAVRQRLLRSHENW